MYDSNRLGPRVEGRLSVTRRSLLLSLRAPLDDAVIARLDGLPEPLRGAACLELLRRPGVRRRSARLMPQERQAAVTRERVRDLLASFGTAGASYADWWRAAHTAEVPLSTFKRAIRRLLAEGAVEHEGRTYRVA